MGLCQGKSTGWHLISVSSIPLINQRNWSYCSKGQCFPVHLDIIKMELSLDVRLYSGDVLRQHASV